MLCVEIEDRDGRAERVRVNMGRPILESAAIPTTLPGDPPVDVPLPDLPAHIGRDWQSACGLDPRLTCVSMGNPHAVLYCRDVAAVPLEIVGPVFETVPVFPRRINVHFVQVHSPTEVTMRTWERGSGITLACGTGACAVAVAGVLSTRTGRSVLAHLPGGDLELEWAMADSHVTMTGPAEELFTGEWKPGGR